VIEGYVAINNEESQEKALGAATKALALDPDNVEATAALGSVAKDRFKYSESIAYFERAIQLNPSFATAYQWYGGLMLVMGDAEAALTRYQQAWSLDPRSRIIGNNLAVVFYMLGRNQEATAMAQEVYRFARDFPEISKVLMHLAIADGECEIAAQYGNRLAAVLKKTTNATPVYVDLCQSTDPEARTRAIETMVSWTGLNFSSVDAATLSYPEDMVLLLANMGEFEAALNVAEKNSDYYSHIVLTWLRSMKTANAIKLYCDPRVQKLYEEAEIPPIEGENICD